MAGRRGDMAMNYPPRALQDNISSLLRDPEPLCEVETRRPASRHNVSSVCLGHSERQQPEAPNFRNRDGMNNNSMHMSSILRSGRKNDVSESEVDFKFTKGRASVPHYRGEANPIINPPEELERTSSVKQFGRVYQHHGDIIAAPPSDENWRPSRNQDAMVEREMKTRKAHGDIITGANQTLAIGSGKRRSNMADSISNRSTLNLLQWNETPNGATPQRPTSPSRNNVSHQMQSVMMSQHNANVPKGNSLIDRLALGTAYAVTAPRSNFSGSGVADLYK